MVYYRFRIDYLLEKVDFSISGILRQKTLLFRQKFLAQIGYAGFKIVITKSRGKIDFE